MRTETEKSTFQLLALKSLPPSDDGSIKKQWRTFVPRLNKSLDMKSTLLEQTSRLAYSVEDTAQILGGVCSKTIYRLLKRGKLKSLPGIRHKLITADSIHAFVALSHKEVA